MPSLYRVRDSVVSVELLTKTEMTAMNEVRGTITRRLTAVGSRSEGYKTFLAGDDGCEYTLYRKDMLPIDDPYFVPYDNKRVAVKGWVEQSREHTSICVDSLGLDEGAELTTQTEEQLFKEDMLQKSGDTVAPKRLPRKQKN